MGRKHCGSRNCLLQAILLFPQCFQKDCTADTQKPGLVWERVNCHFQLTLSTLCSGELFVVVQSPSPIVHRQHLPCRQSGGHLFRLIDLKIGQTVFLNRLSEELEFGSPGVKN